MRFRAPRSLHATVLFGAALLATAPGGAAYSQEPTDILMLQESRLEQNARRVAGRPYQDHTVTLRGSERYVIAARSYDFDTTVSVHRPGSDDALGFDDDGGEGLNSRLMFTAPASGEYTIRVSAFASSSTGSYGVRVARRPPPFPLAASPVVEGAILWTTTTTAISVSDQDSDKIIDYALTLDTGEDAIIRSEAGGMYTSIEVLPEDESAVLASADSVSDERNGTASLLFQAAFAGNYIVRLRATALDSGTFPITVRLGRIRTGVPTGTR